MSVLVVFECSGCGEKADGIKPLRKEFVSVSGRSYGLGSARWSVGVDDVVPDGWIAFDPYTHITYCPTCWASIENKP